MRLRTKLSLHRVFENFTLFVISIRKVLTGKEEKNILNRRKANWTVHI